MYPLKHIGWMGVLCVLVFASEIYAQQPELQRHLTRGKLWATFRNTGTQGLRDDSRLGRRCWLDVSRLGHWRTRFYRILDHRTGQRPPLSHQPR